MYLLERAEGLHLEDCSSFKNILSFGARRLNNLRVLSVEKCHDTDEYILSITTTTTIVDEAMKKIPQIVFSSLECLYLNEVTKLKAICDSHYPRSPSTNNSSSLSSLLPPTPMFGNLRLLKIYSCNRLKHILPMSLAQGLLQLEVLEICGCRDLEEIFVNDLDHNGDEEDIKEKELMMNMGMSKKKVVVFPRLRSLTLDELENVSTMSKGVLSRDNFDWPSLVTLILFHCPNLKRVPLNLHRATKLRNFIIPEEEEEWLNGLEWDDESEKEKALRLVSEMNQVRWLNSLFLNH
ncbi:hypothetical protein NE237_018137 [Protea cynaroides]|uniref:Disease resistance protein At4g27190-like leucine-rich repeats domain-containing protein n=1 Tax=Protea cynaroides TaxID=273540 RepID=A0A9Q0K9C3_9MAGN|nr:hypothetical protein NE237_018137 [Protea cynaroides]